MTLIAKPVVENKLWIVTDGVQKVGNVISEGPGFDLILKDKTVHLNSTVDISHSYKIVFESGGNLNTEKIELMDNSGYPTDVAEPCNTVYDAQKKLHLYTPTPSSKCYQAAGWFAVRQERGWDKVFCPKYIFLQRYEYIGPEISESVLDSRLNTNND